MSKITWLQKDWSRLKKMKRKKMMRRKRALQIKSGNFKSLKKIHQLRIKAIQAKKILNNNKIRSRKVIKRDRIIT